MKEIIEKVQKLIEKTPTGGTRDELTEINILLHLKASQLEPPVMQKIAGDLIKEFDNYLLDVKNCKEIKSLNYKTDIDFASLLFRIIAKRIIEKYASNFSA